jgi:small-conductance mechanosensitive channel
MTAASAIPKSASALPAATTAPPAQPSTAQAIVDSPDALTQLQDAGAYLSRWLVAHSGDIALATAAGALIYLVLRFVRRTVRRAAVRHANIDGVGATTLRVLARTSHFFLVMVALRLVVGYANPPQIVSETIRLLFLIAIAGQVAIWAREVVMSIVRQRAQHGASETLGNALSLINVLVSVAVFFIAAIVVLDNVGVNVTGLVAGLGIGGIAIGLAARGIFEDLFAALSIIFDRPFRQGETVGFDGKTMTVERIGLKSTRMRALSGEEIVVSNTNLLNKELHNFTTIPRRRFKLLFGITYETSPDRLNRVPQLLREVVEREGAHVAQCGLVAFAASSIDGELHYDDDAATYAEAFDRRTAIILGIVERLTAEGIRFAYPTQVSYTAAPDGRLVMPFAVDPDRPTSA